VNDAGMGDGMKLRPTLLAFAQEMERVLRANDYKGGWQTCQLPWLLSRLCEEAAELVEAFTGTSGEQKRMFAAHHLRCAARELADCPPLMPKRNAGVAWEAADVANFCMMIWDVATALRTAEDARQAKAEAWLRATAEKGT
jgi:NTP pyrophosphatase (non-canonical NTP hydrolase)